MRDCPYCDERLATEDDYVAHLHEAHGEDELERIDRRRVERVYGKESADGGGWTGPIAIGSVLLIAVGLVGAVVFVPGVGGGGNGGGHGAVSSGSQDGTTEPSCLGAVHYHGSMRMTVTGTTVDFSTDRDQLQDRAFHFEGGDGTRWHVHARGVTLRDALSTLGIGVTDSSVTYDGVTYRSDDPDTSVAIRVDGTPVTPRTYILERGDRISIVVEVSSNES